MTFFPQAIDTDAELPRVDDNVSEISGELYNALRDAVIQIERTLGKSPAGSLNDLVTFLSVSFNLNGTLKQAALDLVGLVHFPVDNSDVGDGAGIVESKLLLDYSTADLHTLIVNDQNLLNVLDTSFAILSSDFQDHVHGTANRHVASHIDINSIPFSTLDALFVWNGLRDKNGNLRSATQVASALLQINDDLVGHENAITPVHPATAVSVDTDNFTSIPHDKTTAQTVFDYLDNNETLDVGQHRATQHSAGIPKITRSNNLNSTDDTLGFQNVVPTTPVTTFLIHPPSVTPVDSVTTGDDIVSFQPTTNSTFLFDAQFSQIRKGDIIRITYSVGVEVAFIVESVRYTPGSEWIVRINGVNLLETVSATAKIDRSTSDDNTYGVLAVAPSNADPLFLFSNLLGSLIAGHPRGAVALGLEFDAGMLDGYHYNLYLQLYPDGNPLNHIINLPAIDVTSNLGITPGFYDLDYIVETTNDAFRTIGYNYRFIAFNYNGNFGLMLADAINGASFAIINGNNSSGTLVTGSYTNNVVGDTTDDFDALGLGRLKASVASPAFQNTWTDVSAAQIPTKVIAPAKHRFFIVNGLKYDIFAPTYLATKDGYGDYYWPATIDARNVTVSSVEVTYKILLELGPAKLKSGKTLVVQPTVSFADLLYKDVDYGRFIIKNVNFVAPCCGVPGYTLITVLNGIHGTGNALSSSSGPGLNVKIYFSEDSIEFDDKEVADPNSIWSPSVNFHRYHEVYVDKNPRTFSHERARMPVQLESAALLRTDFFHITDVSPKLRGYADSLLNDSKYLRFYVLNYDPVSGEYDGYLGQRDPSSTAILRPGDVVTNVRKNVPAKFYDETNVDWLEIEFFDTTSSPGIDIMSTNSHRYVDIQLFPSLRLDAELLFLASCEANWMPSINQEIIEFVKDKRQFGSVDENNFTNSAIEFINVNDKYLHENGVIYGLDFDFINPNDNRQIFFKGGSCFVDGGISLLNNISVNIPKIYQFGSSLPQSIVWIICVNKFNELVPILGPPIQEQFFGTIDGINSYYVPSVTFLELILTRKDLCPIYGVIAHIASITISPSDILDVRRFIVNQGLNQPLVLNSDKHAGNFASFQAFKNWNAGMAGTDNIIYLKGNFLITSDDDVFDFTDFSKPIIIDGSNAIFTVTNRRGFILGSNITLRNFEDIIYNPTDLSYGDNGGANNATIYPDLVNHTNGCFYLAPNASYQNIFIDNCHFECSLDSILPSLQRPPFISMEVDSDLVLKNVKINNCTYIDTVKTADQAAIAIINLNSAGSGTRTTAVIDLEISDNICNRNQGIYLTSVMGADYDFHNPGLNVFNCKIDGNKCGIIGYFVSGVNNDTSTELALTNLGQGLIISNNDCHYIATTGDTGLSLEFIIQQGANIIDYSTSSVWITKNRCNWIHVVVNDDTTDNEISSCIISENILTAYDFRYLTDRYLNGTSLDIYSRSINAAIILSNLQVSIDGTANYQVINNNIRLGKYNNPSTVYKYDNGIYSIVSTDIGGNSISGLGFGANGILCTNSGVSGLTPTYQIHHNKIYRGTSSINSYINAGLAASSAIVTDNIFDDFTVDGINNYQDVIEFIELTHIWTIANNKNHQMDGYLMNNQGSVTLTVATLVDFLIGATPGTTTSYVTASAAGAVDLKFFYNNTGVEETVHWSFGLSNVLPLGSKIISIIVNSSSNATPSTSGKLNISLVGPGSPNTTEISLASGPQTLQLTISNSQYNILTANATNLLWLVISIKTLNSATPMTVQLSDLVVTFRY